MPTRRSTQGSRYPPPPSEAKQVGLRIQALRTAKKLTQEKLAERAEMDRTYLAGCEVGMRNPSLRQLLKISRGLGVPLSDLFTGIK